MGSRAVRWIVLCLLVGLTSITSVAQAADLDLGAYKGKVVYVDFWASWCTPCRQSFPWMSQIQQLDGPRGLVVIAVDDNSPYREFFPAGAVIEQINRQPVEAIAGVRALLHSGKNIALVSFRGAYRYVVFNVK